MEQVRKGLLCILILAFIGALAALVNAEKEYSWVDEYGKKHVITQELIELEKARLEQRLESYKKKLRKASGDGGWKWYKMLIKKTKKKIAELEQDPKKYFYRKGHLGKQIINPYTREKIPFDGGVGSHGNYYKRVKGGYILIRPGESNKTNTEFIPIK